MRARQQGKNQNPDKSRPSLQINEAGQGRNWEGGPKKSEVQVTNSKLQITDYRGRKPLQNFDRLSVKMNQFMCAAGLTGGNGKQVREWAGKVGQQQAERLLRGMREWLDVGVR